MLCQIPSKFLEEQSTCACKTPVSQENIFLKSSWNRKQVSEDFTKFGRFLCNELAKQEVQQLEAEPRLATFGEGCRRNHDQFYGETALKLVFC